MEARMQAGKSIKHLNFIKNSIIIGIFILFFEFIIIQTQISNLPKQSLIPFLFFVLPFNQKQLDRKSFIQYIVLFLTMSSLMALPQLVQFFARYHLPF